ncbi:hypothetical protein PoB_007563900 [Plakobranchus ocellatus]|uniref:Uncharacterized protein n=1 Tax=Plakobranchus ocellatus TaxID=259542 RepID=A0AAV4DY63_9GAST|nr:hypothetical protein PoB_007563900 [Plakobranchus ocellatus]
MLLVQLADTRLETAELAFQEEVMNIYKKKWQLMAAAIANVFHCDKISIYPSLGPEVYQSFFSRTIKAREKWFIHVLPLLWSATENHTEDMPTHCWTANHVAPLMGISHNLEVGDVDET